MDACILSGTRYMDLAGTCRRTHRTRSRIRIRLQLSTAIYSSYCIERGGRRNRTETEQECETSINAIQPLTSMGICTVWDESNNENASTEIDDFRCKIPNEGGGRRRKETKAKQDTTANENENENGHGRFGE